ncbi:MAG: hypothetical protein KGJ62_12000 [Armatimonadetes bacterium]|nr:hypothetical protein [Armatimonadota bacterium]MDE2206400.1 hypothetical protein [Armatimonadota bacterium]
MTSFEHPVKQPQRQPLERRLALFCPESYILVALCLFDLISTLWLIALGHGAEANPVMGFYVRAGLPVFAAMKLLLVFAPVVALEVLRRRRPRFIRLMLRVGIAAYAFCYGFGIYQINAQHQRQMHEQTMQLTPAVIPPLQ